MIILPPDPGYRNAIADLWASGPVRSMEGYPQHGETSCLLHSLRVSYLSYCRCLQKGLDARAAARAGLLHDLFLYDWHTYRRPRGVLLPHGFTHPRTALENARRFFVLTDVEEDCILHHMWPLTPVPPLTAEGMVITRVDKWVSLLETLHRSVPLPVLAKT